MTSRSLNHPRRILFRSDIEIMEERLKRTLDRAAEVVEGLDKRFSWITRRKDGCRWYAEPGFWAVTAVAVIMSILLYMAMIMN